MSETPPEPIKINETIAEDAAAIGNAASMSIEGYMEILATKAGYIEVGIIALTVVVSWCVGAFIRAQFQKRFHTLFDTSWGWLMSPLKLLPSLLTVFALPLVTPVILQHMEAVHFTGIALHIAVAWLCIRAAQVFIRSRVVFWMVSGLAVVLVTLDIFGLLEATRHLLDGIGFSFGETRITMLGVLKGIVLCILLFWAAFATSYRVERQLRRSSLNYNIRELLIKCFKILLFVLAIVVSLTAVGVDLTALAVLGGALGVGIGFGLQTITSNFISGIILLLDKSIKQGDLIEVGGVEGYVRQLNIRSTTIETFSGQEVSVPNETLLSSNLTNFTMRDNKARIEIAVGVAYGSDYELVQTLLLQAANSHPRCMSDPEPGCFMREFADSSVNFSLLFWVEDVIMGRLAPHSDVMFEITRLFKEHHIEIPFPQRDVNLRQVN